jgi:hypothetical protein
MSKKFDVIVINPSYSSLGQHNHCSTPRILAQGEETHLLGTCLLPHNRSSSTAARIKQPVSKDTKPPSGRHSSNCIQKRYSVISYIYNSYFIWWKWKGDYVITFKTLGKPQTKLTSRQKALQPWLGGSIFTKIPQGSNYVQLAISPYLRFYIQFN